MTVTLKREREIEGVRVEGLDRDEGDQEEQMIDRLILIYCMAGLLYLMQSICHLTPLHVKYVIIRKNGSTAVCKEYFTAKV
jgi:hypothetical protein